MTESTKESPEGKCQIKRDINIHVHVYMCNGERGHYGIMNPEDIDSMAFTIFNFIISNKRSTPIRYKIMVKKKKTLIINI